MKKFTLRLLFVASAFSTMMFLASCGSNSGQESGSPSNQPSVVSSSPSEGSSAKTSEKTFTKEELKKFDGQNGNPAYIAIEGKVYDVTNAPRWNEGMHEGVKAGEDLTDKMKNAPHGLSKLEGLTVVGVLK